MEKSFKWPSRIPHQTLGWTAPSSWNLYLQLFPIAFPLSLILATPVDKSHPKPEFQRPLSTEYAPNIVLTLRRTLAVDHWCFPKPAFTMPFVLLVLGKLIMLSRSPNPFKTSPTKPFVFRQFGMGWKSWDEGSGEEEETLSYKEAHEGEVGFCNCPPGLDPGGLEEGCVVRWNQN